MIGVYKTNIDCYFIREIVENYCTLGKIQPCPTIHSALRALVNSRPRLNFTSGTIIFHHSPHEQSIFVYYQPRFSAGTYPCTKYKFKLY